MLKIKMYCPDCGSKFTFNFESFNRIKVLQCMICKLRIKIDYSTPVRILKLMPE